MRRKVCDETELLGTVARCADADGGVGLVTHRIIDPAERLDIYTTPARLVVLT